MKFNNEEEFDRVHAKVCPNDSGCWNVVSHSGEAECAECPTCRSRYTPVQAWFNGDANPQFDDNGRKTGSGEYQETEFEGEIPDNMFQVVE